MIAIHKEMSVLEEYDKSFDEGHLLVKLKKKVCEQNGYDESHDLYLFKRRGHYILQKFLAVIENEQEDVVIARNVLCSVFESDTISDKNRKHVMKVILLLENILDEEYDNDFLEALLENQENFLRNIFSE